MRRIAVINQKGGVGKTTTTANLGAALAEQGRRVVLVDMDAQANLSLSLGVEAESGAPTSYTVLVGDTSFEHALRPTAVPNLSLVPSNIDLSGAELELASQFGREFLLRDALKTWEEAHKKAQGRAPADYVLFDCPPSLGLLAVNALAASGEVLITLQTEFLALQGMSKLVEVVQLLRKRLNPELVITGILPCLYESRVRLAREVLGEIKQYFPGQVFPVPIRSNVKLAEAPSFGQTILQYAPDSIGATDYRCAAREVLRAETRDADLAGLPPFDEKVLRGIHRSEPQSAKPAPARAEVPVTPAPTEKPVAAKPIAPPAAKAPDARRTAQPTAAPKQRSPSAEHVAPAVLPSAKAPERVPTPPSPTNESSTTASRPAPSTKLGRPEALGMPKEEGTSRPSRGTQARTEVEQARVESASKQASPTARAETPPRAALRAPGSSAPTSAHPAPRTTASAASVPAVAAEKTSPPQPAKASRGGTRTKSMPDAGTLVPAPRADSKLEKPVTPPPTKKAGPSALAEKRARPGAPKAARQSVARAETEPRVLRAEELPPLPPDAFEILGNFGLDS